MSTAQDLRTAAIYDNRLDDVAWAVVGIFMGDSYNKAFIYSNRDCDRLFYLIVAEALDYREAMSSAALAGICNRSLYAGGVVRATERYHGIEA